MSKENTQQLAERIANLLQENDDSAFLRSSIEKINERLDRIENNITSQNPQFAIRNPQFKHPSQEKFSVAEAVADEITEHLNEEKTCQFEPNGKPCDHCSMCSSRGF